MSEATITAIAPWFGGKRTMAPLIVRELGTHHTYWEPFCGSMAVLLAKPKSRSEIVNDLHRDLVNLARVIQHEQLGPKLYRRLRRVFQSEAAFKTAKEGLRGEFADVDPCIERAHDYFLASWQGMNGVGGTAACNVQIARRFTSGGGDSAVRWRGAVNSIPQFRRRLAGVQVLNADGIELCERIEDLQGTVIYADPPYLKKGARYVHDFDSAGHSRLAAALRRFKKTRVVVSYYADEKLSELYPGWTLLEIDATKGLVNQGKRGSGGATKAPEVLLINGPSFAEDTHSLFAKEPSR